MMINQKGLIQWIALLILAVALPAVLYLAQKTQIFKPRAFDTSPPSAEITSPANNTTVSIGNSVSIAANASDSGSDLRGMEIFRARTTADLHSGTSFTHVAGSASSGCSGGSCSVSGSWTPQAADLGDWYIVVNAYSGTGNCSGNPGFLPDGWSNCGTNDSVVVHVSGGTTLRATIVVAERSQGGSGNYYDTVYPGFKTNLRAQAQSTGSNLETLRINVTDESVASTIAQTGCSGTTCEVSGSYTWPDLPAGTSSKHYFIYVEAETVDGGSCSGRGNPAAGTQDCAPGSNFITAPSAHLSYLLQLRPAAAPAKKYRKGSPELRISGTQGGSSAFVNCVEDPSGPYNSFYECAADYSIYCCSSGCNPIKNQFTGLNDACWLSTSGNSVLDATYNSCGSSTCALGAGQFSHGNPVYPAGTTTNGVYQSTTSTYTGTGGVTNTCPPVLHGIPSTPHGYIGATSPACGYKLAAGADPSSITYVKNIGVTWGAGSAAGPSCSNAQSWKAEVDGSPLGTCINNPDRSVTFTNAEFPASEANQNHTFKVTAFSDLNCTNQLGTPATITLNSGPACPAQPPAIPTVLYRCETGNQCVVHPVGEKLGGYSLLEACQVSCGQGVTSVPPVVVTSPTPGVLPAKFKVANFEGSGGPTAAQCEAALASAGFQTWTSTTTVQDNISHTLRNVVGIAQYVCAQFYSSNDQALGSVFSAPIIYNPSGSPSSSPAAGCICQSDNSCSAQCSFEKHAGLTTYASPIRCAPTTATYNTTPTQANKDDYCKRTLRTKGDADGNRLIGNSDRGNINYGYYLQAVLGQPLPPVANPDFSGDGEVGTADLDIWRRSRQ